MPRPLYLLRLDIETRRLHELARTHRLPAHDDLGYVLHAGFAALFGEHRPVTFAIEPEREVRSGEMRPLRVLAYSERSLAELEERARIFAAPEAYRLCIWDRAADKPMPQTWRSGQGLGFQVRVCPTVRVAKAGPHQRAGAEVDAFLAAARQIPDERPPEREAVYRAWLRDAFARSGGATLERAALGSFQVDAILRRTQEERRRAPYLRKPDATLLGALTITDPERFDALLRRGVGRHRAFGFGMLLLRPDRGEPC